MARKSEVEALLQGIVVEDNSTNLLIGRSAVQSHLDAKGFEKQRTWLDFFLNRTRYVKDDLTIVMRRIRWREIEYRSDTVLIIAKAMVQYDFVNKEKRETRLAIREEDENRFSIWLSDFKSRGLFSLA